MLFKLLLSKAALLCQALATLSQLGQADHLGLVGLQKAEIGRASCRERVYATV